MRSLARSLEQLNIGLLSAEIVDNCSDTLTVTTGTLTAGTVADLQETGGTTVHITEVTGTPGFDVELDFSDLGYVAGYSVKAYYAGSASHDVRLEIYNYTTTAWDTLAVLSTEGGSLWHWYSGRIRDTDYLSAEAAKLRFYHYSAGDAAHDLYIDFVSLLGFRSADA